MIDPFYTHSVKTSGAVSSDINVFMGWLTKDAGKALVAGTKTVATLVAADVVAGLLCQGTSVRVIINGVARSAVTYSDTGYNAGRYKWYQFEPVFDRSVESSIDEAAGRTVVTGIKAAFVQIDSQVNWRFTTEPEYYSIDWPLDTVSAFWLDGYGSFTPGDSDRESFQHYRNEKQFWTGLVNCTVFSDYSEYDPDMQAIFERMTVQPSDTVKQRYDEFMREIKAAGVWDILDTLGVARHGETQQAQLLDWVRPGKSYTIVGANANVNATYGFEAAAGSYFNTDYNPAVDAVNVLQNSYTAFAWVTKLPDYTAGNATHSFWRRGTGNTCYLSYIDSDGRIQSAANNASLNVTTPGSMAANEMYAVRRSASNAANLCRGTSVLVTSATASSAWSGSTEDYNFRVIGANASADVSGGVGIWGMGGYLDDTKIAALRAALINLNAPL